MIQDSDPYKELGSQAAQRVLDLLEKNWKSFFQSIKDWSKNPQKYLGKPRLPKYKKKDGRNILILKNIQFSIQNSSLRFSWKPLKSLNNKFKTNIKSKLMQVRFIPRGDNYALEIVYEIDISEINEEIKNIIGIDAGLENLATITNNIGIQPIVIKGRILKSVNQYYNKRKAELQCILKTTNNQHTSSRLNRMTLKRENKIKDYMHKTSKYIISYCESNNIDTIVIGHNNGWKQEINIGKQSNQSFTAIPFDTLIKQIQYKAENVGIKVIVFEESYTSKASFLDNDIIPVFKKDGNEKHKFSGKRIKRGMYKRNID
jgi:putative transposase